MKLTEDKLRSIIREELLQEFDIVPATSVPEVERFVNKYVSNVDASNIEVVDAAGDRYSIMIPKNAKFTMNVQAWSSRLKDSIVSIGNLTSPGGEIAITMKL